MKRLLILLASAFVIAGCDLGLFNSSKDAVGTIALDLSALNQPADSEQQQPVCFSAIESVELSITGGRPPVRTLPVEQGQDTIEFPNVRVKTGTAVFAARIISNNGETLFSGERTEEIEDDGFQVLVQVERRNPVLVVCANLRWSVDGPDFCVIGDFVVFNPGIGTLRWTMESPVSADGAVGGGQAQFINMEDCFEGAPILRVWVTSDFGEVDATIEEP